MPSLLRISFLTCITRYHKLRKLVFSNFRLRHGPIFSKPVSSIFNDIPCSDIMKKHILRGKQRKAPKEANKHVIAHKSDKQAYYQTNKQKKVS